MKPHDIVIYVLLGLLALALFGFMHALDNGWLFGPRRSKPATKLQLPALAKRGPNRRHRRRQGTQGKDAFRSA